jgi:FtsP/CotA-like multicopper oxidase with cupredoxin domain
MTNNSTKHRDVVVVGAGQAGLAIGYFLAKQGTDFTILEAASEPAAAWLERWNSLKLFTSARYDSLPGMEFPGDPDRYPSRDEVADYLTDYARRFELPVELNSRVRSIRRRSQRYALELDDRTYEADQVVVATGPFQVPFVPAIADQLDDGVVQMHSTAYRSPESVPEGPVLVVGGGNTGFQIAEELSAVREVHLAIGSRQTPLPQRILGRDLFWYLDALGLIRKPITSRMGKLMRKREDTLIGSNPRRARGHGIELHGRAIGAAGSSVSFAGGADLDVRGVIWATGFRVDHSWIDVPVFDENGRAVHARGVTSSPGLYFLGQLWQHTRGSALLGWVKDDAAHIADKVASFRPSAAAMTTTPDHFPTDVDGLPEAHAPERVELSDGDEFNLRIAPVAKRIGDDTVRMLAYNGSIPGPVLRVQEGAEIVVNIDNQGDMEGTVHWHGLRLENRYDGTHDTQAPVEVGERFSARVTFPDPGAYWYHPHIREDYGQELGLYGNCLVTPADPDYWPPANRDLPLTLDDILLEDGKVAPFSRSETTYVAMGRFGDVLLTNGETDLSLDAQLGEVVRLYFTNTANTRTFKVALPGARMKLVGGDSGHVEREEFVEDVVLAPSERAVVDVLFDKPGDLTLEHRTPDRAYPLAVIHVSDERIEPSYADQFEVLRTNADMVAERERIAPYLDAEPDKTLGFIAEMDMEAPEGAGYACPMHPEVVSDEPGHCPKCQMKLLPAGLVAAGASHGHEGHDHGHEAHDHDHEHSHAAAGGIEWEDDMVDVNRMTTPANMRWKLVDRETDAENAAIDWRFRVGDQVKIRLLNELAGDHPMHHPFHVHGAGRFLVLSRDGAVEPNLVWKDTVLVRTGETVDILLDVTNVGRWMAHCHIAEHHESGMMFSFNVEE